MSFFKKKKTITLAMDDMHVVNFDDPEDTVSNIGHLLSLYKSPFVLKSHTPTSLTFSTVQIEEKRYIDEELETIKFLLEGHFKKSFMAKDILLYLYDGKVITTRPDDGWNETYLRNLRSYLESNGYTGKVTVQKLSVQKNNRVDTNADGDLFSRINSKSFEYDVRNNCYLSEIKDEEVEE